MIFVMEEVILEVNGKKVKLKDFPLRALKGTVVGFVKSLNLEEEPKQITVKITLNEKDSRGS